MNLADKFFVIFFITIICVRVFILIYPISSPTIYGIRIHHYMYGIIGIPIALALGSLPVYAISIALFVDELTFILTRGKTHRDNYSYPSLVGTTLFIIIVFIFRSYIIIPFLT